MVCVQLCVLVHGFTTVRDLVFYRYASVVVVYEELVSMFVGL